MAAIALGLVAALAWGLHDFAVRYVSQRVPVYAALLAVLVLGFVFLAPVLLLAGLVEPMSGRATGYSLAAGAAFALAGIALYQAFAIGPVRLVAPVIGAFPVLSVGFAAVSGVPVSALAWVAVVAVVGGIALVAGGGAGDAGRRGAAIAWSALAAVGFFATFSFGQAAAQGAETGASLLITRGAAAATIVGVILVLRASVLPERGVLFLLAGMGAADAIALTAVMVAGNVPNGAYAVVGSSIFGIVTIILARVFLHEPMSLRQWIGVAVVFCAIGYLAATG